MFHQIFGSAVLASLPKRSSSVLGHRSNSKVQLLCVLKDHLLKAYIVEDQVYICVPINCYWCSQPSLVFLLFTLLYRQPLICPQTIITCKLL